MTFSHWRKSADEPIDFIYETRLFPYAHQFPWVEIQQLWPACDHEACVKMAESPYVPAKAGRQAAGFSGVFTERSVFLSGRKGRRA